ncbi:hypothetical protein AADG42_05555 [Ammonicoccus fulvus]|uniref:Uncharacterized protein n=1 Tax=Ammonicoccus fulvus TaxID=3138240 RepID=A0ABZ3FPL1_9ACTN
MTASPAGPRPPRLRRRRIRARLGVLAAAPLLAYAALTAGPAYAEPVTSGVAFTIGDPRITESSGLAADTDNNVFWTVNDSGDRGIVYAVGPEGRTRGTVEFSATPQDVEAVAYANGRLYVADIGDNARNRESVTIYAIASPTPGRDVGEDFTAYQFVYPDGPRDAEAILVDAAGRIRIVSKEAQGGIYLAPRQLSTSAPNRLERVADAKAFVTDGTVLPDGRFVVRTYVAVEILDRDLYSPVARGTLPFQLQGESLTVSLSGSALLVGSEGQQSAVLRVPIPEELAVVPNGGETPPPSPDPTPEPTPEPAPGVGASINRTGTLIAIGMAVLLSILAGAVVFLRDRNVPALPPPSARRGWEESDAAGTPEAARPEEGTPEAESPTEPGSPQEGDIRTVLRDPNGKARDPWQWAAEPMSRDDSSRSGDSGSGTPDDSTRPREHLAEDEGFDWDESARQFGDKDRRD